MWATAERYVPVLVEGTAELRRDYGLQLGEPTVQWYGPSVRLLGAHCDVKAHADVRDGDLNLLVLPPGQSRPSTPGLTLQELVAQSGQPDGPTDAREVDRLSNIPSSFFRSRDYDMHTAQLRLLCRLLAKHGHRYLIGDEPLPEW